MGNCFSCAGDGGRKNVRPRPMRVGNVKRSFQSEGKSSATASTHRSAGSMASQEWEAEAASGFISFGSDISKSFIVPSPIPHGTAVTQPQTFGGLMAKEDMREDLERRNSLAREFSVETTATSLCRDQARDSLESTVSTPTKNVFGLDLLRNSQRTPSATPLKTGDRELAADELRDSPPRTPTTAKSTSKGHGDQLRNSVPRKVAPTQTNKGSLDELRDTPVSPRTAEPARNVNEGLSSPAQRPVARKVNGDRSSLDSPRRRSTPTPTRKMSADRSGLDSPQRRPAAKSTKKVIRERSRDAPRRPSAILTTQVYGDYPSWISPEEPPAVPVAKFYDHMEKSPEGLPAERTDGHSVVDLMNMKGRQELERLRGLSPDSNSNPSLKKGKPTSESFEHSQKCSLHSKEDLPVDFDFLTRKFINDDSKDGKVSQTSQARERDRERSARVDLLNHLTDNDSRSSSLSVREILDEFSKSYKESAAKAAAKDRDNFKSLSSESTDGSVGSPPAAVRNRRKTVGTHPDVEEEITPASVTFEELLGVDSDIPVKTASTISRVRRSFDFNRNGSHQVSNHRGMTNARTGAKQPG